MPLTATAINAAKPKAKAYKLTDELGLYLLVMPTGGRLWRMNYRYDGKQKTLAFGNFPDLSLAKARELRAAAREALALGEDPTEKRKALERETRAKQSETFRVISSEWLDRLELEGRTAKTLGKLRWIVNFALPLIGDRPIADLTVPELLEVLRPIEARGRFETANRLRSTFGTIYRYAIATGRAQRDLSADLRGALISPKTKHRAAILEPKAFAGLLRAIDGHDGQPSVRIALQLMAHLFVRPGELRCAEWNEFDLETRVWSIPAEKMKMRRAHKVPLSVEVIALIQELRPMTGSSRYLFPSIRTGSRPIRALLHNCAGA